MLSYNILLRTNFAAQTCVTIECGIVVKNQRLQLALASLEGVSSRVCALVSISVTHEAHEK